MLLVREGFLVRKPPDLGTSYELLWVELCIKRRSLCLGLFYCSPKNDVNTLQVLLLLLTSSNIRPI